MVKICVSIPTTTTTATTEAIRGLTKPDLIELRLDYAMEHLDLEKLRESTSLPLIATARLPTQGGRWGRGECERQRLLLSAVESRFDYVDLETNTVSLCELVVRLHEMRASVIVSSHYLDRTPTLDEMQTAHGKAKRQVQTSSRSLAPQQVHRITCPALDIFHWNQVTSASRWAYSACLLASSPH